MRAQGWIPNKHTPPQNHPAETMGSSMLSNDIEQLRYDATMDMEEVMLGIREQLRKDLVVKTMLKPEEVCATIF